MQIKSTNHNRTLYRPNKIYCCQFAEVKVVILTKVIIVQIEMVKVIALIETSKEEGIIWTNIWNFAFPKYQTINLWI